jgi:predicted Zn-dependent protease
MMKSGSKYGAILSQFFDKCVNYIAAGGAAGGGRGPGGRGPGRVNLANEFETLIGDVQAFQDGWSRFISGLSVPPAGEVSGNTFTSDTMGFEITKPAGWSFINEGSAAGFQTGATKSNSKFEVMVYANSGAADAKTFATQWRSQLLRNYVTVDLKDAAVGSLQAAELTYSDENRRGQPAGATAVYKYKTVIIATSDRIYMISFQAFASVYDQDAPEFDQAVQSFKLSSK